MAHPVWPLFDLEIRTPRVVLRIVDDATATRLVLLAASGIHDPDTMPFAVPWTDAPSPELERGALQHFWRNRADLSTERWQLDLAVTLSEDDTPIGCATLRAEQFSVLREVATGSWLGRAWQGRGYGREMRVAALQLAFAGLGAERAKTRAFFDNAPSLAVTRSLGYTQTARGWLVRRGERVVCFDFEMMRPHWETAVRRDDIDIVGLDPCLPMLGVNSR